MLIWMRDSAFAGVFKFLLLGVLLLAVAGLVMMDVGGFFTGNMGSGTIVKGGGVNIGATEFDRTVRRSLSSQGIPANEAYKLGLIDNILSGEIQNRLFTKEAQGLGLIVDDDSVKAQISRLAEPLATEGRSKKEALQQILRTQGISEGEFVTAIRTEMANGLLRAALQPPATLTSPLMAKTLYRFDNEKRAVDAVVLKNASVPGITKPTGEQLEKYYAANKTDFLIPETRRITIATLKGDMIRKNVAVTDEQLRAEYDRNVASFTKPERRAIEQIVVKTEEEAKKAAADMKAGTPVKGTLSQEYEEQGLLPQIGAPVFAAQKGGVVGPIKTDLGWHVLLVKDVIPAQATPFADMKDKLKTELENASLTEELFNTGNIIEDRVAGGDKLEDIVNEYGMTTEIIGPFRRNGNDTDGKDLFKPYAADREKLIQSAFDFDEGEIAPVVETADGQFHLMRIDQVVPDSYRDMKTVRADLEKRWTDEQRKLANKARATAALEKLNAGKTVAEIAAQDGGTVQSIAGISRSAAPPAPITAIAAAQIFTAQKGKAFSSEIGDGYIVGVVKDITMPPAPAEGNKDLATLEDLTGRSLGQDILGLFASSIARGSDLRVNKPVLEKMYGDQAQE